MLDENSLEFALRFKLGKECGDKNAIVCFYEKGGNLIKAITQCRYADLIAKWPKYPYSQHERDYTPFFYMGWERTMLERIYGNMDNYIHKYYLNNTENYYAIDALTVPYRIRKFDEFEFYRDDFHKNLVCDGKGIWHMYSSWKIMTIREFFESQKVSCVSMKHVTSLLSRTYESDQYLIDNGILTRDQILEKFDREI